MAVDESMPLHNDQYDAFISYSHSADSLLAPELQRLIRRVGRPWYSRSKLAIFRDQTNLAMSESLWGSIEAALRKSKTFVLLASPAAKQSPWVDREVRFWREHRERAKFYIVLTDGEVKWDEAEGDFDWSRTTALSHSISGWFDEEPGWLDVRQPAGIQARRNQRNDRLRDAARTVAAPLYGLNKEQIDGVDEREYRRTQRTLKSGIATLVVLTILALAATGIAYSQYKEKDQQLRLATSRLLVTQAESARSGDPRTALRLEEAAHRISPTAAVRSTLIESLLTTRYAGTARGSESKNAQLTSVAFSPDGHLLAAGDNDGSVLVWDTKNLAQPRRLGSPSDHNVTNVDAVAFSPDGQLLAISSFVNATTLWDVSDPSHLRQLGQPLPGSRGKALMFSPNGRLLVTNGDNATALIWDVTTPSLPKQLIQPLVSHSTVMGSYASTADSVAFSPDGNLVIAGNSDYSVTVWNIDDPASPRKLSQPLTGQDHGGEISVAVSPDGRTLATGGVGNDGAKVILWDISNPSQPLELAQPPADSIGGVSSVSFSPDGLLLAATSFDGSALIWNVGDPTQAYRVGQLLTGHTQPAAAVAFSSDGQLLATASWDNTVIMRRIDDQNRPIRLGRKQTAEQGTIHSIAFSANGSLIASGGVGRSAKLWDIRDIDRGGLSVPLVDVNGNVDAVAFSQDGRLLAAGGVDFTPKLWDITDPAHPRRIGQSIAPLPGSVRSVAFSPNGQLLAAGSNSNSAMVIWDISNPDRPRQLGSLAGSRNGPMTFSRDGRLLATTADAGFTMLLWDITNPAQPRAVGQPIPNSARLLGFSPDGQLLATGGWSEPTTLWDMRDLAHPRQLGQPFSGQSRSSGTAAFSPDGHILALDSDNGAPALWDISDPNSPTQLGVPLLDHPYGVGPATFSADGQVLAAGDYDGTVILWRLDNLTRLLADPMLAACAVTAGGLTPAEWARYVPGLPYEDSCST